MAKTSLRKVSPRTFLAAHDSAYSSLVLPQIGRSIRLPRLPKTSRPYLSLSSLSSLSPVFLSRERAFQRRESRSRSPRIVAKNWRLAANFTPRWLRCAESLRPIDCPIVTPANGRTGTSLHGICRVGLVHLLARRSRGGFASSTLRSRGRSFTGQSKLVGWQYVS